MKKRFFFAFMAAACLGVTFTATSCSDDDDDSKGGNSSAPKATMIFNEFVQDGGIMKIKGSGLSSSTKVTFVGKDGAALEGTNVSVSNGVLSVTVPEGVAEQSFVTLANGDKKSECPIMIRDTRNMLIDFDTEASLNSTFGVGAQGKGEDGSYVMVAPSANIPENYHAAGDKNQYGWFSSDDWQSISFVPGLAEEPTATSVFSDKIIEDAAKNITNYTLKFEMCVPKDGKTNGLGFVVGFSSNKDDSFNNARAFSAFFQPAVVNWDKSDTINGWSLSSIDFYEQSEWMTVSIPMSEFVWNAAGMNYLAFASSLVNGYEIDADNMAKIYTEGGQSYAQVNAGAITDARELKNKFGSLIMCTGTWDFGQGGENMYKGILAIDNVRLVPNDGNGAVYNKLGFGVPSQHFNN